MELKTKTVFVTGSNRGIGKALVQALLERGVKKVYAAARNTNQITDFNDSRVEKIRLDITDQNQIAEAVKQATDTDVLINNAGTAQYLSILEGPLDLIKSDMMVNYYSTLNMMRAFIPVLEGKSNATIANVISMAAFVNFPFLGGYCASKAALFSLTQGARIELAAKGIKVHSINPGPIDTDMAKGYDGEKTSPEETAKAILEGLIAGDADIFPDPHGRDMFDVWNTHYRDLEQMVSDMMNGE